MQVSKMQRLKIAAPQLKRIACRQARCGYIRSGPEGARGVLKGRGWSLCMFLSELLSFRLPSSGCLSVGLFIPLTGARGTPGLVVNRLGRTSVFQLFFRIGFWMVF